MNAVRSVFSIGWHAKNNRNARVIFAVILASWLPISACAQDLSLINGDETKTLAINDLRQQSDITLTVFDPFQGRDVEMHGLDFRRFLIHQFGEVPPVLHFTAWDDYEVTLGNWHDPKWLLVTEQDGEPLTLRSRGPLRLVERTYDDQRAIENLREFSDWVWMIRSIEAHW